MTNRRLLTTAVTAWVVLLVALALFWPFGEPTVREQTTAADGAPHAAEAVDAAARVLKDFPDAAYQITPYAKAEDCKLNLARTGVVYRQVVRVHTRPENAVSVADRLNAALADRFSLVDAPRHGYMGTAGGFVDVRLEMGEHGLLTWTADAGCRPDDEPSAVLQWPGTPPDAATALAERLGATPTWTRTALPCGAETVTGTAQVPGLAQALPELATDATFTSAGENAEVVPTWIAVRSPGSSLIAAASGDTLTLSATTDCP